MKFILLAPKMKSSTFVISKNNKFFQKNTRRYIQPIHKLLQTNRLKKTIVKSIKTDNSIQTMSSNQETKQSSRLNHQTKFNYISSSFLQYSQAYYPPTTSSFDQIIQSNHLSFNSTILFEKAIPSDYLFDITSYLRDKQDQHLYRQTINISIDNFHRFRLIQVLSNLSSNLKFQNQTLFLAVSIVDRVLGLLFISKEEFHILGLTALVIACKFQQIAIPRIQNLLQISQFHEITKQKIIQMEQRVVESLNFNISYISPIQFIRIICTIQQSFIKQIQIISQNIAKMTLFYSIFKEYKSSVIAIGCLQIASNIQFQLGSQLIDCITNLKLMLSQINGKNDLR